MFALLLLSLIALKISIISEGGLEFSSLHGCCPIGLYGAQTQKDSSTEDERYYKTFSSRCSRWLTVSQVVDSIYKRLHTIAVCFQHKLTADNSCLRTNLWMRTLHCAFCCRPLGTWLCLTLWRCFWSIELHSGVYFQFESGMRVFASMVGVLLESYGSGSNVLCFYAFFPFSECQAFWGTLHRRRTGRAFWLSKCS